MDVGAITRFAVDAAPVGKPPTAPQPVTLEACHEVIAAQAARLFQLEAKVVDL